MTRKTVGNGEPTSSHPFVLGSRKTQKNTGHFRSGGLGKHRRTRVIFVLGVWENAEHGSFSFWGSGKTQKNTGHFRSGGLGKRRRTRVIFVLGYTETQRSGRKKFLC